MKARTEMALHVAKARGGQEAVVRLRELLDTAPGAVAHHFANAFDHPLLTVYTDEGPHLPQLASWGLVPAWAKDGEQARTLRTRTLNARGETIFDKPAFRASALGARCLVHVEGFYEHHHLGGRAYPWFIHLRDRPHFALAGLWAQWQDPATGRRTRSFSIVTTAANDLLRRIHNKPGPGGPRMPLVLPAELEDEWLRPITDERDAGWIRELMLPFPAEAMEAHPVRPLLGRGGTGDREGASDPFAYPELTLGGPPA